MIYEFKCNCGHEFDIYTHDYNKKTEKCPVCGEDVKRVEISGANFNAVELRSYRVFGHGL